MDNHFRTNDQEPIRCYVEQSRSIFDGLVKEIRILQTRNRVLAEKLAQVQRGRVVKEVTPKVPEGESLSIIPAKLTHKSFR